MKNREETESLNLKFAELSDEDLAQVNGGIAEEAFPEAVEEAEQPAIPEEQPSPFPGRRMW